MVHPVFSLLISRPDLAVDHASAYAALVQQEATGLGLDTVRRGLAWVAALVLLAVFLVLAGTATMLGALQGQFHWALAAAPAVALGLAFIAWLLARRPMGTSYFPETRAQIAADAQVMRAAAGQS